LDYTALWGFVKTSEQMVLNLPTGLELICSSHVHYKSNEDLITYTSVEF